MLNRSAFIALFIGTQVVLIVLQIHKHTCITRLSYEKGKNEAQKQELLRTKQDLTNQLYTLADRTSVKQFASEKLKLQPISISQVKKISTLPIPQDKQVKNTHPSSASG